MPTKIAINGFGRIGRLALRQLINRNDIEIVAINNRSELPTMAHLFKYDSAQGKFEKEIKIEGDHLVVDGKKILRTSESDPANLPWGKLGVEIVLESTGIFLSKEKAAKHLEAGAKKVVLSAPPKGDGIKSIVLGVNEGTISGDDDIISNSSCTTNCLAPMVKVLDDLAGVESGFLSTIHAYTADQRTVDGSHKDLRRARAAAANIIPTSTGAAKAVGKVLPHLEGALKGNAYRVPVVDGSITDFVCNVKKEVSEEEINQAFKKAAGGNLKGIIEYNEDPIVSSDIIGNTHSCIFEAPLTMSTQKQVKIVGWYDNEMGYATRSVDLIQYIDQKF